MRTLVLTLLLTAACLPELDGVDDTTVPEGDTDTDTDTDADSDTDADADADTDADTDPVFTCEAAPLPMVQIPSGTFLMGSPEAEVGRGNDEALHYVTLSRDYCIGSIEITRADWDEVVGSSAGYFTECGETCPIESIDWHQAAYFTNKLSGEAKLEECYDCVGAGSAVECTSPQDPYTCDGYRLPTEAEWERAARAQSDNAFPEGGELKEDHHEGCDPETELTNGVQVSEFSWWCGHDDSSTHLTGVLDDNPFGLHDMRGNVYEWCHDWYDEYDGDSEDPSGPSHARYRVLRGGSFAVSAGSLRSAFRHKAGPDTSSYVYGFRIARTLPE